MEMSEKRHRIIGQGHPGLLDVIGDVHGEFDAQRALLGQLSFDERGLHPDGRSGSWCSMTGSGSRRVQRPYVS